jgi:hypothetical protein
MKGTNNGQDLQDLQDNNGLVDETDWKGLLAAEISV